MYNNLKEAVENAKRFAKETGRIFVVWRYKDSNRIRVNSKQILKEAPPRKPYLIADTFGEDDVETVNKTACIGNIK